MPDLLSPLGVDSIQISPKPDDLGSVLAAALNSNEYFSVLYGQNYMGVKKKDIEPESQTVLLANSQDVFNHEPLSAAEAHKEILRSETCKAFSVVIGLTKTTTVVSQETQDCPLFSFRTGYTGENSSQVTRDLCSTVHKEFGHAYLGHENYDSLLLVIDDCFNKLETMYFGPDAISKYESLRKLSTDDSTTAK